MNEMRKLMETVTRIDEGKARVKKVHERVFNLEFSEEGYPEYDGNYMNYDEIHEDAFLEMLQGAANSVAELGLTVFYAESEELGGYLWDIR